MEKKIGKLLCEKGAKPKPKELAVGKTLITTGHNVKFLAERFGHSPDIKYLGTEWEIKQTIGAGRRNIENILRKASKQSENIILDLSVTRQSQQSIINEINRQRRKGHDFKRVILIGKSKSVVEI